MSSAVAVVEEGPLSDLDAGADDVQANAHAPDGLENLWQVGVPSQRDSDVLAERTAVAPPGNPAFAGDLPREMYGRGACLRHSPASSFVLTVADDAMNGAGILRGDQLIVDCSLVAEHGQIVVALIDQHHLVARLFRFNGRMELRAQRMGREATRLSYDAQPFVWGVVVAVLRSYARDAAL